MKNCVLFFALGVAGIAAVNQNEIKALCELSTATTLSQLHGPKQWTCVDGQNTTEICPFYGKGNPWLGVACNYTNWNGGDNWEDGISVMELRLSGWQLNGTIPASISLLSELTLFVLTESGMGGPLPTVIYDIPTLQSVLLYTNHFTGTLPAQIPSHPYLKSLDVSGNQLTGTIPDSYGHWASDQFYTLTLHKNLLTGTIPSSIGDIKGWKGVFNGDFYGNPFVGPVPDSFCNLPKNGTKLYFSAPYENDDMVDTIECYPACLKDISVLEVGDIPVCK